MYRRKIIILISLIGVVIGLSFIFRFYKIFFWSNTIFENKNSFVFIDRDDDIDSLTIELKSLLKSTDDFILAAKIDKIN